MQHGTGCDDAHRARDAGRQAVSSSGGGWGVPGCTLHSHPAGAAWVPNEGWHQASRSRTGTGSVGSPTV